MHLLRACSASSKQACRQLKLVVVFDIAYYKFIREQSSMSEHAESDVAQEQDDDELVKKKVVWNWFGLKISDLDQIRIIDSCVAVLF